MEKTIFSDSSAAVVSCDKSGKVINLNLMARELTGWSNHEAVGLPLTDVFHIINPEVRTETELPPGAVAYQGHVVAGRRIDPYGTRLRSRNGIEYNISYDYTPVKDAADAVTGMVLVFHNRTDWARGREFAQKKAEELRQAFDFTYDWEYWVDSTEAIIHLSASCERISGYSKEEFMADASLLGRIVHPEDRARHEQHLNEYHHSDVGCDRFEFRIVTKSGEVRDIQHACQNVVDSEGQSLGRRGSNRDITEQKRTERELEQVTASLSLAARAARVGIWEYDVTTNGLTWDEQMFRLYGIKRGEFTGAYDTWERGVHPDDLERSVLELQRAVRGEKEFDTEFRVIWPDGSIHHIRAFAILHQGSPNEPLTLIGTNYDITESKVSEERLRSAVLAAEAGSLAKSVFLANMSHEIRTPMNAILGYAQVMQRDPALTLEQAEHLSIIIRSGSHLVKIINDILDMSKIESGRSILNKNNFCLRDLLDDVEFMFRSRAEAKGLKLLMEAGNDVPPYLRADEGKLRQVLVNLVGNAVKFTDAGGVAIRVRADEFSDVHTGDKPIVRMVVEVEDSGPGISDGDLSRLFVPFMQGEDGAKVGGTGLGLAISRKFVEMMGGHLDVITKMGKGSCFRAEMLLETTEGCDVVKKPEEQRITGVVSGAGQFRVLVVDDIKDNRNVLLELLRPVGFDLAEACNGVEALEKFATWAPHAVLMDMRMPIMDGYEAVRRLRISEAGRQVLIIAVTASAFEDSQKLVMAVGVDGYLRKPFRAEELFGALKKGLELDYIYAQTVVTDNKSFKAPPLTAEALSVLPDYLVLAMREAIDEGDRSKLKELIFQVENIDLPLAAQLHKLADRFDYDSLIEGLRNLKNDYA